MATPKRHLITSALPYANGALHLGHLAGAYLPADIYARYLRLLGRDVAFVCGSDEHGAAITIRAKKEGRSPRDIIDTYHELNKASFQRLGISFDMYHRTSAQLHHETAQEFFKVLFERGDQLEERRSEQYYDEEFDQFLADRYIVGTCPRCSYEEAYGDQCENCGSDLSPTELIKPRSTLSGKTPMLRPTTHWFFKLNEHAEWLREWIVDGTVDGQVHHEAKEWKKHVVGQCLSWLDGENGLQPRSITRDLNWGIPVPIEGAEGKVLYVWFDAPIGYISSTKQWLIDQGRDPESWREYWQSEDCDLVHFIGKDNIVFHCIVFPAMLKAHGDFNLPVNVPANQFLNFEGRKFSKSKGWGIEQHQYLEAFADFPNKEDALRYTLLRNLPENRDSDFKWDDFIEYHDKELADNLGNFVNRVIVLSNKYYDGKVPAAATWEQSPTWQEAQQLAQRLQSELERFAFKAAANTLMEISSLGNTHLQDVSPWKLYKENPDSPVIAECMFLSLQIVTLLSILTHPFIPFTSVKIRRLLELPEVEAGDWQKLLDNFAAGEALLATGHKIGTPELLFAKIHDRKDSSRLELINGEKEKLAKILAEEEAAATPEHPPVKAEITYDDFAKLDIRTGTIVAAEKVKKADKLLELKVDLGFEQRTVVSGIAKFYKPEEVIGQEVLLLANLAPRKLRGIESQGMILMAEDADGKLCFVSPEKGWPNGFAVS